MAKPTLYILAGGRSKRFGSDKARAVVEGQTLLQRVAAALAPVTDACIVVAAEAEAYSDLGFETLGDTRHSHGPLGGLETALEHHTSNAEPGWIALASCDLLDPKPEHLAKLIEQTQVTHDADPVAVVFETDRPQPFPGLYHTAALARVKTGLAEQKPWGMIRLLRSLNALLLPAPDDWPTIPQANRRDRFDAWKNEQEQT
ncbi:MAG: molybdenum cofactor guanylyltransferase [Planctomycetota bacterium]